MNAKALSVKVITDFYDIPVGLRSVGLQVRTWGVLYPDKTLEDFEVYGKDEHS